METRRVFKVTADPAAVAAARKAALRAEVELELQSKKQCGYKPYECTQLALDRHSFCMRHILEDKGAPYKQCSFVYASSGKRCHLPAPKLDKKEYRLAPLQVSARLAGSLPQNRMKCSCSLFEIRRHNSG